MGIGTWIFLIVAVGAVVFFLANRYGNPRSAGMANSASRQGRSQAKQPDKDQAVSQASEFSSSLQALLQLQLDLRDQEASPEVCEVVEPIIESLGEIIPRLDEEYEGAELTFTANRIAGAYLPDLFTSYFRLSVSARKAKESEILGSLQTLAEHLQRIVTMVVNRDEAKFAIEVEFLKQKFASH